MCSCGDSPLSFRPFAAATSGEKSGGTCFCLSVVIHERALIFCAPKRKDQPQSKDPYPHSVFSAATGSSTPHKNSVIPTISQPRSAARKAEEPASAFLCHPSVKTGARVHRYSCGAGCPMSRRFCETWETSLTPTIVPVAFPTPQVYKGRRT